MTMQEYELRDGRRFAVMAAAAVGVAVLQGMAGRWWFVVLAVLIALLSAVVAAGAWGLAKLAEPWQEAQIRRPRRWELWWDGLLTGANVLLAVGSLVDGRPLDAASWLLVGGVMWLHFVRDREARRLTEPPNASVRPGPPEEWL